MCIIIVMLTTAFGAWNKLYNLSAEKERRADKMVEKSARINKALENHKKGYNCAQAVACAYCDAFGIDEQTAFKMAEGFGFGMGTMGTCGAVSAMALCAGMKNSDGDLMSPKTKKETYRMIKEMTKKFQEMNSSVICREIKGVDTGKVLRSCDGCREDAAKIIEDSLL